MFVYKFKIALIIDKQINNLYIYFKLYNIIIYLYCLILKIKYI